MKKKLDKINKELGDEKRKFEGKDSLYKNLNTSVDNLKNDIKEKELKIKEYIIKELNHKTEITSLMDLIESLYAKDKIKYQKICNKLDQDIQNSLTILATSYKFKWS